MAGKKKSKRKTALAVQPSAAALERFKAAGIACGYEPAAMDRLAARCEVVPLADRARVTLTDPELSALIDDRLAWMFEFIDGYTIARMSGRDLLVGLGILFDKRQLLKGEPTAVTRFLDMRNMDEVMDMFRKEMVRRDRLAPPGNGSPP